MGEEWLELGKDGSPPFSSNMSHSVNSFALAAQWKGVQPFLSGVLGSAPLRKSILAATSLRLEAARWSSVVFSVSITFTGSVRRADEHQNVLASPRSHSWLS